MAGDQRFAGGEVDVDRGAHDASAASDLADRAMTEATDALGAAAPCKGEPADALARMRSAIWQTVGRYHALVQINSRLGPEHNAERALIARRQRHALPTHHVMHHRPFRLSGELLAMMETQDPDQRGPAELTGLSYLRSVTSVSR